MGTPTPWQLAFKDDDGDVTEVIFEARVGAVWLGSGSFDPGVKGQTQGFIAVTTTCSQPGRVDSRVILKDGAGNTSAPYPYNFECVVGGPPPPSTEEPQLVVGAVEGDVQIDGQSAQVGQSIDSGASVTMGAGGADCPSGMGLHALQTGSCVPPKLRLDLKCARVAFALAVFNAVETAERYQDYEGMFAIFYFVFRFLLEACYEPQSLAVHATQAAPGTLTLQLIQGAIQVQGMSNSLPLSVETPTTTVSPSGKGNFSVGYNPTTGTTLVAADQVAVNVQPRAGGQALMLQTGQQVQVTQQGQLGEITPIGQPPSPGLPPPAASLPLEGFDENNNDILDDNEFFAVIDAWIAEQIDDATFFRAIDLWISQGRISSATSSSKVPRAESIKLTAHPAQEAITFIARGQGISSIGVEIYDLNGRRIFAQEEAGTRLIWNLRRSDGERIANGVYLYTITAQGFDGSVIRSDIKKLLLLR